MEFAFSEDERAFANHLHDLLETAAGPDELRKVWAAGHEYDGTVWKQLVETGVFGICIPEQHGGAGGSLVDLVLPLEACGYWCVAEPVVESAVLAPHLREELTGGTQPPELLEQLAEGRVLVAASLDPSGITPDGLRADAVIVARGAELHLVPRERAGWQPLTGTDPSRRLARGSFDIDDSTLLSRDPAVLVRVGDLAAAATACVLVGGSQRLLHTTRDYVMEREQFGHKIGSFQALKHRLADVAVQLEAARSLAWYSCVALANRQEDGSLAASRAKAAANRASELAGFASLQLHGGIGFTWEHDLHMWLQRNRALESAYGTTSMHRERVGRAVLASSDAET